MATTADYIEYVCGQIHGVGAVRYKKLFGEYMVYVNNKPIMIVCDNTVFVKILPCLDEPMAGSERGFPYSGAKEHYILDVEDRELAIAVAAALEEVTPIPKPKAKKKAAPKTGDPIGDYIAEQPEGVQPLLREVYAAIKTALPSATEKISYQMPTFWNVRNLIHFAAMKNHLGIYPGVEAMENFAAQLTELKKSKGAIQFPYDTFNAEHTALIAEIAEWCGRNNAR